MACIASTPWNLVVGLVVGVWHTLYSLLVQEVLLLQLLVLQQLLLMLLLLVLLLLLLQDLLMLLLLLSPAWTCMTIILPLRKLNAEKAGNTYKHTFRFCTVWQRLLRLELMLMFAVQVLVGGKLWGC
jgi:hypothetical protein